MRAPASGVMPRLGPRFALSALALLGSSTFVVDALVAKICPLGTVIPPTPHTVVQRLPGNGRVVVAAADWNDSLDTTLCTPLVTLQDGAAHLLLACGKATHTASAIVDVFNASAPGVEAHVVEGSPCALVVLRDAADYRAVVNLGGDAGLSFDALTLPATVASFGDLDIVAGGRNLTNETVLAMVKNIKDEIVADIGRETGETGYYNLLSEVTGAQPVKLPDGSSWTIQTRNTYQAVQSLVAAEWLADWFTTEANLEVSIEQFTCCGNTVARNVVARLPGSGPGASEVVVVGAHMDSLPTGATAPGAVDNGSGTVALLVLAKAFAKHSWNRTIEFVAFGAEEQGIHGSAEYVRRAQQDGVNIISALCMDMIAYSNRYFGVTIEGTRDTKIQTLMKLVESNTHQYAPDLQVALSDNSFGSDHVSFQRAGIPAILGIELDDTNYPHYHRVTDTVRETTPKQALDIVKGMAAALVDLAGVD